MYKNHNFKSPKVEILSYVPSNNSQPQPKSQGSDIRVLTVSYKFYHTRGFFDADGRDNTRNRDASKDLNKL